ncbi:MAG: TonB-dependent receptor plug domain-containing protein, partial [Thauera phenolivorans]|nr:TonB-dependent receptor plug domain-containing protein [Thauera phenolivorans]
MSLNKPNVKQPATLRRRPALTRTGLALGLSTAMLAPAGALGAEEQTEMMAVEVVDTVIDPNPNAEPGVPYKARTSGDKRHVKPLAETPQTIQVITAKQLEDSGRTDLRDILQAQPGITLGTGENGNAFGDRYIIRGQEARSDVFVDGLRDPGMTVRESFATEQVEITKGPSSTFAGRGATGGAVNSVTKQATTDLDFAKLSAGFGSDDYRRYTFDGNRVLTDTLAVRVNLLDAYQEVPDRGPADRDREGAAVSLLWKPTDKLDVTADYYFAQAEDKPDLGAYIDRASGRVVKDVPVYLQDEDFLMSKIDTWTLRVGYQLNPDVRIENLTRYGTTENGYVATGYRGSSLST